jgi:dTMP kinase
MTQRGKFIVLEGIDGAGTTTQSAMLAKNLKDLGYKVVTTQEPTLGPVGLLLRAILRGRVVGKGQPFDQKAVALLFAADRLDHIASEIAPFLDGGFFVVSDRYVLSSLAYQSLYAELGWVKEVNRFAINPDLTIFLDVPVDVAVKRIASSRPDKDIYEDKETLTRVYEAYRNALSSYPYGEWVTVDGTKPVEEVALAVLQQVKERVIS